MRGFGIRYIGGNMKILTKGAEAILYLDKFEGEQCLIKERISKGYRIKEIDEKLRKERTSTEISLLDKTRRANVKIPRVLERDKFKIYLEYLEGHKLKDVLNLMKGFQLSFVCKKIGENISKLHSAGIVHGDMTTSNMVVQGNDVYFIDFSLGRVSKKIEDQAVDLFLLYEALKSTHFQVLDEAWKHILDGYKTYSGYKEVLKRFEEIGKRRRYKTE